MVKLQAHDPEHIKGWQEICDVSKKEFKKVKQNIYYWYNWETGMHFGNYATSRRRITMFEYNGVSTVSANVCHVLIKTFDVLQVYERLGVVLLDRGESFYQSRMEDIVKDLNSAGMLEEDEGRKVRQTFLPLHR